MVPEKRERKKIVAFDPHPPGEKHQMMADRSRKVKAKKENRDRMKKIRLDEKNKKEGAHEGAAGQGPSQEQEDVGGHGAPEEQGSVAHVDGAGHGAL